jgi:glycosyltransferase involved in cell wall biosynthesis
MIIGIDGNEANNAKRVGIGEYAYELIKRLAETDKKHCRFVIYLKDQPLDDMPTPSENVSYKIFGPRKMWTQFALPARLYLENKKPHVFFSPSHYAPRISPVPTVISVMDLSYLHFPELFNKSDLMQLKNWTAYSVRNAKKIITISKSSMSDIIEEYGVPKDKVVVSYPGIKPVDTLTPHIYAMNELQQKYKIPEKYVLFVGTLQPRKNIARLIEAFSMLIKEEKIASDTGLVIVGKKGWLYDEILSAPEKFEIQKKVHFVDFVTNEDLALLYQHAQVFVLPSLYEGFGLPVLEAMKYNCPVITSKVSSLPEVGGDAAVYIDPEDVKDIAEKVEKVLNDSKMRKSMIEKGKEQVKKFSWDKSARETLAILEEVGKGS